MYLVKLLFKCIYFLNDNEEDFVSLSKRRLSYLSLPELLFFAGFLLILLSFHSSAGSLFIPYLITSTPLSIPHQFLIHRPHPLLGNIMDQGSSPHLSLDDDLLDLSINDPQISTFNELTLIGFILSDKMISFKAIKAILHTAWDLAPNSKSPTWTKINLRLLSLILWGKPRSWSYALGPLAYSFTSTMDIIAVPPRNIIM